MCLFVFALDMGDHGGGEQCTTTLHNVHSTPMCQHGCPCTIHRTQRTWAPVRRRHHTTTLDPTRTPTLWGEPSRGMGDLEREREEGGSTWGGFPRPGRFRGVGHREGDPAVQEAIVCHHSAIRGQDNNLLVAMK